LIAGVSGVVAVVSALPIFEKCLDSGICGILTVFAFPGMLLSAAASGNVHDFNRWLVVLFNWILYAAVLITLRKLIRIFRGN
jgi:hypothetical protein